MRAALLVLLIAGCSGHAGARDRAESLAAATHCDRHACPTTAEVTNLGDGCYVVDGALYQCASDGHDVSCFEITPCAELCERTVTDGRGFEVSTDRCEQLGSEYEQMHRPPPTCAPVELVAIRAEDGGQSRSELVVPEAVVLDVARSGKSKVVYEVEVCATDGGVTVGDATHTTGFAALDEALHGEAAKLVVAPGTCTHVALIASRFECS